MGLRLKAISAGRVFNQTDCVLVMGRRGCGKSHLAQKIQALWPRRIIIDSLNEYSEGEVVHSFHEFTEALLRLESSKPDEFTLVVQFHPDSDEGEHEFDEMLRLCFFFGNVQIVVEEVQLYSSPHALPEWLKKCLLIGRHNGLSLLFTTQRPGELNKTIFSQCIHIFCGQIIEGNDLRYISNILNQDADRLSSLPAREFLYFSEGEIKKINNDLKELPNS